MEVILEETKSELEAARSEGTRSRKSSQLPSTDLEVPIEVALVKPNKKREATDKISLTIFLLALILWFALGGYGMYRSSKITLSRETTHELRRLAIEYYNRIREASKQYFMNRHKSNNDNLGNSVTQSHYEVEQRHFNSLKMELEPPDGFEKNISCQNTISPVNTSSEHAPASGKDKGAGYTCVKSSAIYMIVASLIVCIQEGIPVVLGSILITTIVSVVYVMSLRWIAEVTVCMSLVIIILPLLAGATYSGIKVFSKEISSNILSEYLHISFRCLWIIILVALGLIIATYIAIVLLNLKKISQGIVLIKEGSRLLKDQVICIILAASTWVFLLLGFMLMIFIYLSLSDETYILSENCNCSNKYTPVSISNPLFLQFVCVNCTKPNSSGNGYILNIFKMYNCMIYVWFNTFIIYLSYTILGGSFTNSLYKLDKTSSVYRRSFLLALKVFRYHLGTVSLGALVIILSSVVRFMKIFNRIPCVCISYVFEKKKDKLKQESKKQWIKIFLNDKLLLLVRFSIINTIIYGSQFKDSAIKVMGLLETRMIKISRVIKVIFCSAQLGIGIIIAILGYWKSRYVDSVSNPWIISLIILLLSTLISSMFFCICSIAIESLIFAFMEKNKTNDNSTVMPYLLPHKLIKKLSVQRKQNKDSDSSTFPVPNDSRFTSDNKI